MAACPRCGMPVGAHRPGNERCRYRVFLREMQASELAPTSKAWGRFIGSLGVTARPGPIRWASAYGSNHSILGHWVPPRYATLANRTDVPPGIRREVMRMMAAQHEHLAAVEAVLKLDPTARAARILIRTILIDLTNPTKHGRVAHDGPLPVQKRRRDG